MTTLFVGLGRMGTPMAMNYARKFDSVLYDVGPSAAATAAEIGTQALSSLRAIPSNVGTVILMVPNSQIVESILTGQDAVLEQLGAGSLIIDMGSSVPASTQRLSRLAEERGIDYVDAPVSGGVAKAEEGTLSVMIGGSEAAVEAALPHIESMAGNIVHVGPSGSGHVAKALNNLLSATNIAAAAEVLTVATGFGIDPAVMLRVINASTGRSQATEVKFPQHVLTGTFDSGFAMDLMVKDLGIARELFDEYGKSGPVTATAFEIAKAASQLLGAKGRDHTQLVEWYEFTNHVLVRSGEAGRTAGHERDNGEKR